MRKSLAFSYHLSLITVVKRHRFVNAVADDGAQCFGAALQNFFQLGGLSLREIFEYEARSVRDSVLRPDADSETRKLVRPQCRDDVLQTLLAAARTARPQSHRAERECNVVADDNQVARRLQPLALPQEARDRLAAQI